MFPRALRFARIGEIELRLDPTLLLFALLVVWTFTTRFGAQHPTGTAITMAICGMVGFFASVLAHELGHALEARYRGMRVVGVTLFLFGGVTEMHAPRQTARDEFAVAAVGPFVSLVCGAVFGLVGTFASALPDSLAAPVSHVAGLLGWLNVVLAIFNLLPGAPLDGGRVLRAGLWWLLGDRAKAVRIAGRAGQALALALLASGIWLWTRGPEATLPAVLSILLAAFLFHAAAREIRNSHLDELYSNHTVEDLVGATAHPVVAPDPDAPTVAVDDDVHTLVERFQGSHATVYVLRDGEIISAMTEQDAARAINRLRGNGRWLR